MSNKEKGDVTPKASPLQPIDYSRFGNKSSQVLDPCRDVLPDSAVITHVATQKDVDNANGFLDYVCDRMEAKARKTE